VKQYSLAHLSDQSLVSNLATLIEAGRTNTAEVLAHIAELDSRRLYAPAGFPSMYAYCVHVFHMTEDEACDRIHAARAAREHPPLLAAVADGRLHLTAVLLLAPHLTLQNTDELVTAATHRRKADILRLLAERFPKPDLPTRLEPVTPPVSALVSASVGGPTGDLSVPERMETRHEPAPLVAPLSAERFGVQFTMGSRVHDKLRHLEALLGHTLRNFEETFELGLDVRIRAIEKRRYAATDRPRRGVRHSSNRARYVQAEVKRAVRERDGGRCTFVSTDGRRCEARSRLEFDHAREVARGGLATAENLRLRCRAHNQYAAEQTYGFEFMRGKRDATRVRRSPNRPLERDAREHDAPPVATETDERDVVPWLMALGFPVTEARRAAAYCERVREDVALEDRVKAALRFLTPPHRLPKKPDEIAA